MRWDDPAFGIAWPEADSRTLSDRDRSWADYDPGSLRTPGHVEIVAADLLDPREQLLDLVERVHEPSAERVRAARRERRDQLR